MDELANISLINDALSQIPEQGTKQSLFESAPNTYIIGCPRSGTTAVSQYLAATNIWNYPSNFTTRFVASPYMALLLQQGMQDAGVLERGAQISFESSLGRSKGMLNINEFFHFFRRFLQSNDVAAFSSDYLAKLDLATMFNKLKEPYLINNKPFLCKAMMLQYNLLDIMQFCSNDLFLYIKREPSYVMQSIYQARIQQNGKLDAWWSMKPLEYSWLQDLSPIEQIAGQVFYTQQTIENALSKINSKNYLSIQYSDFTQSPSGVLSQIAEKYSGLGTNINAQMANTLVSAHNLENKNQVKIDVSIFSALQDAYKQFELKAMV